MRWTAATTIAIVAGLACSAPAYADRCGHHRCSGCVSGCDDGCGGCGHHRSGPCRVWSPSRQSAQRTGANLAGLQSREGKVAEVNYLPGGSPDTAMVEIRVLSGTDTTPIRLGPAGFLRDKQLTLREGDAVRVTGYSVATGDGELLVATEITHGGRTVRLRNERGQPAW